MTEAEIIFLCPECGSLAVDALVDPDYNGEPITICHDCGFAGEDKLFEGTMRNSANEEQQP